MTTVYDDTTLDRMLEEFKKGKSHMSFVTRVMNDDDEVDPYYAIIGLVTLEDVIEEIIQSEIIDETDIITDNVKKAPRADRNIVQHDLSLFVQDQTKKTELPQQLAFAAFQYLYTMVEPFRDGQISETILRRLLKKDVVLSYKMKTGDESELTKSPIYLYERGKPADYFIMILEGHVKVTIGAEEMVYDSGPFSCYGVKALTSINEIFSQHVASGSTEKLNMKNLSPFIPDYTLQGLTSLLYLCIKRSHYLAARRATLMELARSSTPQTDVISLGSQADMFADELNKLTLMAAQSPTSPEQRGVARGFPAGNSIQRDLVLPDRVSHLNTSNQTSSGQEPGEGSPLLTANTGSERTTCDAPSEGDTSHQM